ncbi:MAG: MFS transporter [Myxococcota bacterium]|jgi:GPH family glycoside/pentoside/hexuronide:cation symporter
MNAPVSGTPTDRLIPLDVRLAFGLGQMAEGIKGFSFSLFALFYYNSVLGLSASLAGAAMGIALLVDAVTDPLAGSISDRWRSKWGRRHPFMVLSALPLGLSFWGLFSPPQGLSQLGLFAWLTIFAVATRTAMTACHVPHTALGAELTSNFGERTRLVATRQVFGYLGLLVMTLAGFGYFFADDRGGRANVEGYSPFGFSMGVIMVVTILISAWGTRRQIPHLPVPPARASEDEGIRRAFGATLSASASAFQNGSFRRLFSGTLLMYIMIGTESALSLYMYDFFWGLGSQEIMYLSLMYPVGLIAGAGVTRRLHELWDKGPTLILGVSGWFFCQVTPVLLRLGDQMPPNGTELLIGTLLGVRVVQGVLVQQALVSFSSMMADIADEHELDTGLRQEGVFFGVVSFSGKAASGAGSFCAGLALEVIGWPAGASAAGALAVPPETIRALGIAYGPMVAVFALLALFAYRGYDLDRERHAGILDALSERHRQKIDSPRGPGL